MWGTTGIGYNVDKVEGAPARRAARFLGHALQARDTPPSSPTAASTSSTRRRTSSRRRSTISASIPIRRTRPTSRRPASCSRRSGPTSRSSTRPNTSTRSPTATSAWRSAIPATSSRRATAPRRPTHGVDIDYVIPKEGALMWFDSFVIPADAPHPDEAHRLHRLHDEAGGRRARTRTTSSTPTATRTSQPLLERGRDRRPGDLSRRGDASNRLFTIDALRPEGAADRSPASGRT